MGRPRSFDAASVLAAAHDVFGAHGYAGTSVDDLVQALNLHRGSLYKAFGSKRGLFVAVLTDVVTVGLPAALDRGDDLITGEALDLVLVAAVDLGPHDTEVAALVRDACRLIASGSPARTPDEPTHASATFAAEDVPPPALAVLGARLINRMNAHPDARPTPVVSAH